MGSCNLALHQDPHFDCDDHSKHLLCNHTVIETDQLKNFVIARLKFLRFKRIAVHFPVPAIQASTEPISLCN